MDNLASGNVMRCDAIIASDQAAMNLMSEVIASRPERKVWAILAAISMTAGVISRTAALAIAEGR